MATINNSTPNTLMSGSSGADSIRNSGNGVTVEGGVGNDLISTYYYTGNDTIVSTTTRGILYQYVSGDGNDLIQGFRRNDTLQIIGGSYTTSVSGNDFIVSVGNGSIILKMP